MLQPRCCHVALHAAGPGPGRDSHFSGVIHTKDSGTEVVHEVFKTGSFDVSLVTIYTLSKKKQKEGRKEGQTKRQTKKAIKEC